MAKAMHARIVDWHNKLKYELRGESVLVTGALRKDMKIWRAHLKNCNPERRQKILHRIQNGVKLPWINNTPPIKPIRQLRNHADLSLKPNEVWRTLQEQLTEGTVAPWDVTREAGNVFSMFRVMPRRIILVIKCFINTKVSSKACKMFCPLACSSGTKTKGHRCMLFLVAVVIRA